MRARLAAGDFSSMVAAAAAAEVARARVTLRNEQEMEHARLAVASGALGESRPGQELELERAVRAVLRTVMPDERAWMGSDIDARRLVAGALKGSGQSE